MKKLLFVLGMVSASCAFSQECPASYQGLGFNGVSFLTDAPGTARSPSGYTGAITCDYGSASAGYAQFNEPGTFTVEQPLNFYNGPGMFVCSSDNPVNCKYLAV